MNFWQRISLFVGIVILGTIVYFNVNPTQAVWMPKCPFKLLTGLQCPGCGGQRMFHALLQGHFREAISYNYYMLFAGPYVLGFLIDWLMPDGNVRVKFRAFLGNKYLVWTYIITFCIWLVVRNILKI